MIRIRAYRRGRMAGLSDEYSGKSYPEIFNLYLKRYGKGNTGLLTGTFQRIEEWSGMNYPCPCYSALCKNNCSVDIMFDTKHNMIHLDLIDPTGASTTGDIWNFLDNTEHEPENFEKFSEQLDDVITDSYQEMVKYTRFANRRHAIKTPSPVRVRKEWHRHNSSRRTIR